MSKKIIVIDLDGTFVSVNTFHKWMIFVTILAFKKLRFISLLNILKIILLRAIKKINHAQMKVAILKISEKFIKNKDIKNFVQSLDKYVHQDILKRLDKDNTINILATGAPQIYAQEIKEKYGFDYEISTPPTTIKPWKENLKEEKKKNLLALLERENLTSKVESLYTDHHDDLPLMVYAEFTYLVNASEETLKKIKNAKIALKTLG